MVVVFTFERVSVCLSVCLSVFVWPSCIFSSSLVYVSDRLRLDYNHVSQVHLRVCFRVFVAIYLCALTRSEYVSLSRTPTNMYDVMTRSSVTVYMLNISSRLFVSVPSLACVYVCGRV